MNDQRHTDFAMSSSVGRIGIVSSEVNIQRHTAFAQSSTLGRIGKPSWALDIHRLSAVALLALLLLASGCGRRHAGKPRMGEIERLPRLETVVLGKPTRLDVIRSYTATVEAFEKADLCAMVKGYVQNVPTELDIGRLVQKNELLLTLVVPDLVADRDNKQAMLEQSEKAVALAAQAVQVADAEVKEANAQIQRYEADVEYRKAQHARITRLAQGETLSQQQLDEAKLNLNASQAALNAGQAQVNTKLNRLGAAREETEVAAARVKVAQAELKRAQVQVDFASLRAPFDGIITKRWVDSGATIRDPAMPLLTIMRTDKVRVIIDVPERDVPYLLAGYDGSSVELSIPSLKEIAGVDRLQGKIALMASALDPVTRTMRAEMHLENKIGTKLGLLKPQMTGTALVTLAVRDAFTIPSSALVRNGNKMEIYVVADPVGDPPRGIVKRLGVQLGVDNGQRVEIRGDSLTGREHVIVKGAGVLRPGDQVIAVPAKLAE